MKVESKVFSRNDIPAGVYKIVNSSGLVLQEQNGEAIFSVWSSQSTQKWHVRYFGPNYDASEGYLISPSSDEKKVLYWDRTDGNRVRVAANSTQNRYTRLWGTIKSATKNSFILSNKHYPHPFLRVQGNSVTVDQGEGDEFMFDSNVHPNNNASWSYVVTSDPQYPWTDKTDAGISESESVKRARSEELIRSQYNDINDYNNSLESESTVMINGDITAYGHDYQWVKMFDHLMPLLNRPYYFGLGNHDIENNQGDSFLDSNFSSSLNYMRVQAERKNIVRHDINRVASQNFALELPGNVFVLQLNNDPTMEYTTWDGKGVKPNWGWIEKQFIYAQNKGFSIIVNIHKPDNWNAGTSSYLLGLFHTFKVKLVFAGHYHTHLGRFYSPSYFGGIPVFLSGSASQSTYLITEYDLKKMKIFSVKNNNWKQKNHLSTIDLTNGKF
jgi:predicted phosphohydrolase